MHSTSSTHAASLNDDSISASFSVICHELSAAEGHNGTNTAAWPSAAARPPRPCCAWASQPQDVSTETTN